MTAHRIYSVLHIEDNPDDAEIIAKFFAKSHQKFRITHAYTGREALEKMTEQEYDAILLDHYLPDTKGLDVLGKIRERDTKIPVIMLTGAEDVRIVVEAMRLGASDYIVKSLEYYEKIPSVTLRLIREYELENMSEQPFEDIRKERDRKRAILFLLSRVRALTEAVMAAMEEIRRDSLEREVMRKNIDELKKALDESHKRTMEAEGSETLRELLYLVNSNPRLLEKLRKLAREA